MCGEHVVRSFVSHLPLLQLVDKIDPAPVIFRNESVFIPGLWNHNRLIYLYEEGTVYKFLLDLNPFLFAQHIAESHGLSHGLVESY